MGLIDDIIRYSNEIQNSRTATSIFDHLISEVNELSEEVNLAEMKRPAGEDGITGEAIDVILCAVDLIHRVNPAITEEELQAIAARKLEKWKRLYADK